MLSQVGWQTLFAATAGGTLAHCDRQAALLAAVILDVHFSMEDVAALFATLRAHWPDLQNILMGGLPEAAPREHLGRGDFAGFLPKPFRMEQLLKTIEGAMDRLWGPVDLLTPPSGRAKSRDLPDVHAVPGGRVPRGSALRVLDSAPRGGGEAQRGCTGGSAAPAAGDSSGERSRRLPGLPHLAWAWEISDFAGPRF